MAAITNLDKRVPCLRCMGEGEVTTSYGARGTHSLPIDVNVTRVPCPHCEGTGWVDLPDIKRDGFVSEIGT